LKALKGKQIVPAKFAFAGNAFIASSYGNNSEHVHDKVSSWIIDTRASDHMTPFIQLLTSKITLNRPIML